MVASGVGVASAFCPPLSGARTPGRRDCGFASLITGRIIHASSITIRASVARCVRHGNDPQIGISPWLFATAPSLTELGRSRASWQISGFSSRRRRQSSPSRYIKSRRAGWSRRPTGGDRNRIVAGDPLADVIWVNEREISRFRNFAADPPFVSRRYSLVRETRRVSRVRSRSNFRRNSRRFR